MPFYSFVSLKLLIKKVFFNVQLFLSVSKIFTIWNERKKSLVFVEQKQVKKDWNNYLSKFAPKLETFRCPGGLRFVSCQFFKVIAKQTKVISNFFSHLDSVSFCFFVNIKNYGFFVKIVTLSPNVIIPKHMQSRARFWGLKSVGTFWIRHIRHSDRVFLWFLFI